MKYLKTIINGVIIGTSMLLPGISGGTMAIMLGIYDRLISAVSNIFKDFKGNVLFLLQVAVGGALGMLLFSKIALLAVETFPFPMHYLFIGAIIGTIPVLYKKTIPNKPREFDNEDDIIVNDTKNTGISFKIMDAVYILIGFGLLFLLTFVPEGLFNVEGSVDFADFMLLLFGGFCISIALVLPGISASYTLLLLGIYNRFLEALSDIDLMFLLPLGLGLVLGTFLVAKTLEKAMSRFTRPTYLIISGFVLASVLELFPGIPDGYTLAICISTFVAGFLITFLLGKKE